MSPLDGQLREAFDPDQENALAQEYLGCVKPRKILAGALIVLGAVLMLAAPGTASGALMIAAAILVEIVGITLEKR